MTKSVVVSVRQLAFGAASAALLVLFAAIALTFFALQPIADSDAAAVQNLLLSSSAGQPHSPAQLLSAKLHAVATRIGNLGARTTVLDLQGESIATLAGVKSNEFRFGTPPGLGGPAPAASNGVLSMDDVEHLLDRLTVQIRNHADNLDVLESQVLDTAGRKQLLPTMIPVTNAVIGSGFGTRTDPFTGVPAMHEGLDFDAPVGTPIMAAGGGIVMFAGSHPDFGNLVEIDDGNGIITRYAHCSRLYVKRGDLVLRGEVIAAVGGTGRATGPHLHFEIRVNGVAQNPTKFLQADLQRMRKTARSRGSNPG